MFGRHFVLGDHPHVRGYVHRDLTLGGVYWRDLGGTSGGDARTVAALPQPICGFSLVTVTSVLPALRAVLSL